MNNMYIWAGVLFMAFITYLIRVLPFWIFRKPIQNQFIQSFLYYVPYAVLAAMTFPAVFSLPCPAQAVALGAAAALLAGWNNASLLQVACLAAVVTYAASLIF